MRALPALFVLILGTSSLLAGEDSSGKPFSPPANAANHPSAAQLVAYPEANGPSVVVNGGFTTDTLFWNPIQSTPSWSSLDANGSPGSGSALVDNLLPTAGPVDLRQCFTGITPGKQYAWGGKVRIPSGQARSGYAYMYLVWVGTLSGYDYCAVHIQVDAGGVVHSGSVAPDTWIPLTGPLVTAPAGAVGAQISFNNQKDQAGSSFRYNADDAYLYEVNVPTSVSIAGPAAGDAGTGLVFEASTSGCLPETNGWNWTATGNATVQGGTTKSATITFPSSGTFTVSTSNSACLPSTASKQVSITSHGPEVAVTAPPQGMVQDPGAGGAMDGYTLTNLGGSSTTVSLTQFGSFFTQSPTSFTLAPGASQRVSLTGNTLPSAFYGGSSIAAGPGASGLTVPVSLLVSPAPSAQVTALASSNRVDVVDTPAGTASFTNSGTVALNGTVASSVPWLSPESNAITIPPGGSRAVNFAIDRTKRPDAGAPLGSVTGDLQLLYRTSAAGARVAPESGASSATSLVTIVDTVKPSTSGSSIPALGAGEIAVFLPGVGHVTGSVGVFLSDVSIVSTLPFGSISDLKMYYTPAGSASSQQTSISNLAAGKPVGLADIVRTTFGGDAQIGTLQLRSSQMDKISVAAAVFNSSNPSGTYGTVIPAFRSDRAIGFAGDAPGMMVLTGLRKDATGHTNLYIQETSGQATKVNVEFRDANGLVLGTRIEDLPAFGLVSRNDAVPPGGVVATLTHFVGSNGRFVAFATPVDEASGDTWAVSDWRYQYGYSGTQPMLIPIAGAVHGANNTYFRTDIAITNASNSTASVSLRYYNRAGGFADRSVALGPLQSRVITDIVSSLFEVAGDSVGYVVARPLSGNFAITSRTYTTVQGKSATFGTGVPTMALAGALRAGDTRRIGGVDDATFSTIVAARPATFRTNFALIETSGKQVSVRVTIRYTYATGGSALASATGIAFKDYTLEPNQIVQLNNIARQVIGDQRDTQFGDLRNMQVEFSVTGGEGTVAAFISSTDNGTGDSILRID